MNARKDLSRWNRASLSRFRYVDGNAVEYLELLRQQLFDQFANPDTNLCNWLSPAEKIPANEAQREKETLLQRQERLSIKRDRILKMYHQDRRDWAWEISRTFARACHILTEYANAYANEGYLGTATQWEHVRRLVEMLDYHPAPPASATTQLLILPKENRSGVLPRGFQVKNSPKMGEDKVVFETLGDLLIDPALDKLRPKGWDKSNDPPLPEGVDGSPPPMGERQFSDIARGAAINLQGIGDKWALQLNSLTDNDYFAIKDFLDLDPQDPGIILDPTHPDFKLDPEDPGAEIGEIRLRELKAKATFISNYDPGSGWSDIAYKFLPEIPRESIETLAQTTGKPLDEVKALQLTIELFGSYLDNLVYENTQFHELLVPADGITDTGPISIPTLWRAKQKPKVVPGQVAMILRQTQDISEAATVDRVEKPNNDIHLLLDQVNYTWPNWPKGEITLQVSPRWQRECWLNGTNIIRTVEPHGLTVDAFISWKLGSKWQYAKVTEADKRDLRLEVSGALPKPGTNIYVAMPITGDKMAADYEEIVMINEGGEDQEPVVELVAPELVEPPYPQGIPNPLFKANKIFSIKPAPGGGSGGGGGGLLPPASLPKIGSFLFPSPMLPMDLVKAAVEMLLNMGVMQIPSTGEFVLKGLPFEGMLGEINNLRDAATALVKMLDDMTVTGKWLGGFLHDQQETPSPIYFELNCEDDQLPAVLPSVLVNSYGVPPVGVLKCLNGKVVDANDIPVGYQPMYTGDSPVPDYGVFKMVEWDESIVDDTGKIDKMEILLKDAAKKSSVLFKEITKTMSDDAGNTIELSGPLLALPKVPRIQAVVQAIEPVYMFNGRPDKLKVDNWVVGRFTDGLRALKIRTIDEYVDDDNTETFSLSFARLGGNEGGLEKVYADFRDGLVAEGAGINTNTIDTEEIELEDVPESLKIGRDVLLTADGMKPLIAKIESVDTENNIIKTKPSLKSYLIGKLIIRGNVAIAGHGEGMPAKILGSGNAARTNQEFTLEVEGVSFIPDATKSSGVAAAIEVEVAGKVWKQVSSLKDSLPGDTHYAIRMTEEGHVKILFGDGQYGRRLPSGKNNIRVRYRIGSGLAGIVDAGSLEKPVNPHPIVEAVRQPLDAAGGGDMEDVTSLRENAPHTLLALERAVSLADFTHLAAGQSNIWQAQAYNEILHDGRTESVRVVIVPAGGAESPDVEAATRTFLQKHALPGVRVKVEHFKEESFILSITIRVKKDEFIATEVEKAVSLAVIDHFTLKNRKLGQHLYLSEVYKVVENVTGVENSICILNKDSSRKMIRAANESTVVYLDNKNGTNPEVTHEEYRP